MDPKSAGITRGLPAPTGDQRLDSIHQELLRLAGQAAPGAAQGATEIVADGWYRQTTSASVTGLVVLRFATSAADSTPYYPIFDDCYLSAVRVLAWGGPSAGTLTGMVYKNDVDLSIAAPPQIDSTTPFDEWVNTDPATHVFAPGDRAAFRITTNGSWTPSTTEVLAQLKFTLL